MRSLAQVGWDEVVHSLKGAIDDRSHVVILGIALGVVVLVYVNWKLAKWLVSQSGSNAS